MYPRSRIARFRKHCGVTSTFPGGSLNIDIGPQVLDVQYESKGGPRGGDLVVDVK